jgi:hypothetical protein
MHSIDYEYTDKDITAWGGLRLVQELMERIDFRGMLDEAGLPERGSNRAYDSSTIIEGFIVSVILGAKRLAHSGTIRHDEVIRKIFGWKGGMASQSTFCRFFKRSSLESNDEIMRRFNRRWFEMVDIDKHTVDIDSSVISRFGEQEGVAVGYNPKRHGRASHHPLIAFSAEARMVIQSWMRTGDSASATCFDGFMDGLLQVLPREKIGLVRADSGFSGHANLEYLEEREMNYIIASRMHGGLQQKIFEQRNWHRVCKGIGVTSFKYQAQSWDAPRRIVVVRKNTNQLPKSGGKTLFPDYDAFARYRYSAFITNMDLSAELIWEIYRKRADAENQIKELKYEYGMEGFCSESLAATEQAFRWVMVAYNLMSLFKQRVMGGKSSPSLATVRFKCIALGSYIVHRGRSIILKIAAKDRKRDYIDELFVKLGQLEISPG